MLNVYHGYRFQKYRQSPFLRLDITVFNDDGMANQEMDDNILENNTEKNKSKKLNTTS